MAKSQNTLCAHLAEANQEFQCNADGCEECLKIGSSHMSSRYEIRHSILRNINSAMKSNQFYFMFWTDVFQYNLMIKQISTSTWVFELFSSSSISTTICILFHQLSHCVIIYVHSIRLPFPFTNSVALLTRHLLLPR